MRTPIQPSHPNLIDVPVFDANPSWLGARWTLVRAQAATVPISIPMASGDVRALTGDSTATALVLKPGELVLTARDREGVEAQALASGVPGTGATVIVITDPLEGIGVQQGAESVITASQTPSHDWIVLAVRADTIRRPPVLCIAPNRLVNGICLPPEPPKPKPFPWGILAAIFGIFGVLVAFGRTDMPERP